MAKKSLIEKSRKPQRYKVRAYTRCNRCGRPRAVYKKFGLCRICLRELAHEGVDPRHDQVELVGAACRPTRSQTCSPGSATPTRRCTSAPRCRPRALKSEIARLLKEEGYIRDFRRSSTRSETPFDTLVIELKFGRNRERVITDLKRVSKPGRRVYARKDRLPRVLGGHGHRDPVHLERPDHEPHRRRSRASAARSSASSGEP